MHVLPTNRYFAGLFEDASAVCIKGLGSDSGQLLDPIDDPNHIGIDCEMAFAYRDPEKMTPPFIAHYSSDASRKKSQLIVGWLRRIKRPPVGS